MTPGPPADKERVVFLLDVDNTLLDNDRLKEHIDTEVVALVGPERARRFWELYEIVRHERDVVDYLETVRRWVVELDDPAGGERLMHMLERLPFRDFLFPHVFATIDHLWTMGIVAILSDGDQTFQRLKIRDSGLEKAVRGNVLITVHKEQELPEVFRLYPAAHYVVVDDKPGILAALERDCPTTFTTILVMQGRYATASEFDPKPDYVVSRIGDVRSFNEKQMAVQTTAPDSV